MSSKFSTSPVTEPKPEGNRDASRPETPEERLLREMVEIRSLSGEEQGVAEYLARRMNELGLDAAVDEVGNAVGHATHPDAQGRFIDIMLLGHMDTVPGDVPVRREGDLLYGRGTVDAKGPLAAFTLAASRAAVPPGIRLVVAGVTEEECVTSRGARHLLTRYSPAACFIGEPSGWDGVTLGYKGRLLVEYRQQREMTHTAMPVPSAGDEFCKWWEQVRSISESLRYSERAFERVQATLRRVNTTSDGLIEKVEALAGFRLPPGVRPVQIEEICRLAAGPYASLAFTGPEFAHTSDRSNPVSRALTHAIRDVGGKPHPKLKTGTSDFNVVGPVWNCPIAAYGPGDSLLDHTPDEHISLTEFARSIDVLTRAIESLAVELAGSTK